MIEYPKKAFIMGKNNKDVSGANNPNYRTGYAIAGKRHSFYTTWQNMKSRCLRKSNPKYSRYGGRGITICDAWLNIKEFAAWSLNNGWEEGLSIDRIDNNGNYEPLNCRWVTLSENSRKKRTTRVSWEQAQIIRERLISGENQQDLAKEYNVVPGTIWFISRNFTHVQDGICTSNLKKRNIKNDTRSIIAESS